MADKCGAKTRAGGRCRNSAVPNNRRCKFHGGMSTGPKSIPLLHHRLTHGIYAKHFSAEEAEFAHDIPLGTLDHELRLVRVMLERAMAAWGASEGKPELDEIIKRKLVGPGSREDRAFKVRDYPAIIERLLSRIESLEKARRGLMIDGEDPDADDSPIGRIIVEVRHAKPSHDDDRPAS